MFLFQIGAIRSDDDANTITLASTFLFQIGAIRSIYSELTATRDSRFLFQIGAIRSVCVWICQSVFCSEFLFQIGAIRSRFQNIHVKGAAVSIPNWCD